MGLKKKNELLSQKEYDALSPKEKHILESLDRASGNFTMTESVDATTEIHVIKDETLKLKEIKKRKDEEAKILRYRPETDRGLRSEIVEERVRDGLVNKNKNKVSKSYAKIIFDNVFTFFNILVFLVALALILVGSYKDLMFFAIAIVNTTIGIVQECRSKKVVDKLNLVMETKTIVIRDGEEKEIIKEQVVLDDLLKVSQGSQIIVDGFVREGVLYMNESLITGESREVKKVEGDQVFAGSFVISGTAIIQADVIGDKTFIGQLQKDASKIEGINSELYNGTRKVIKWITCFLVPLAIVLGVFNYLSVRTDDIFQSIALTVRKTAGSVIGMIPAGMFLLTSVALAYGVINLAKKKTIVKDLYRIEMLARADVLCLDKTGTITDGTMSVEEVIKLDENIDLDTLMKRYICSFNDSNSTSDAFREKYGYVYNGNKDVCYFSSSIKKSACKIDDKTYVLGAPEYVCKNLSNELKTKIVEKQKDGYRAILLGTNDDDLLDNNIESAEPLALFFLADHIREEAYDTIKWFIENGVEIKIISGDDPNTVTSIARRVGLGDDIKAISLEGIDLFETSKMANKYQVFGRVTPDQKAAIIRSLKDNSGKIVAMTGDGVNDILAMKSSDCSIAMANGSEATKSLASLVLTESSFDSLPAVVREGRRVVNNIQASSSMYLMKTLFTMLVTFIIVLVNICGIRLSYPFEPSHMMILEVCVIGMPTFFIALQPNEKKIEGHFLTNLFSKALVGTVCLFIPAAIALIMDACGFFRSPTVEGHDAMLTAFMVVAVNFAGILMFFRVCYKFNLYRAIIFSLSALFTVCFTFFLPSSITGFYLETLETKHWIALAITCPCLIPVSIIMNKFVTYVVHVIEKKTKKSF